MRCHTSLSINRILLLLLMAITAGCGSEAEVEPAGGDSNNTTVGGAPEAPAAPSATDPADPATAAPAADGTGDPNMPTVGALPETAAGNPADPNTANPGDSTPSPLPDNVAEWTPDNFRNAARQRDRRLKPAIESLVGRTPGDAQTAGLLEELLTLVGQSASSTTPADGTIPATGPDPGAPATPPTIAPAAFNAQAAPATPMPIEATPATPMPIEAAPGTAPMPGEFGRPQGQGGTDVRGLVHTIIDGLVKNNSTQAWQTLNDVLAGQIKTAVDDRGITDWILTAALDNYGGNGHPSHTMLEAALRNPESLNSARGKELGDQAAALVRGTAASVMDYLMGVPGPQAGSGQNPQNHQPGSNQIPGGGQPMPVTSPAGDFRQGGNPANANSAPRPITAQHRELTDDSVRSAVQYLWSAEMLGNVESDTRNVQSFAAGVNTLALAGSLPSPGIRKATSELLLGKWRDGATPLLQSKLYQSAVRDPGLIVVLKQLPRIMPTGAQTSQQNAFANPQASKSQRESMAKQTWMGASAQMVLAVIERLNARPQNTGDASMNELPVRLHRDARVLASHELNWIDGSSEAISGVAPPGPLKLQYVRLDVSQNTAQAFQFYKKQLKRGKDYKFPQGAWIDSLTAGATQGTRRSIDILIKQGSRAGGANTIGGPQPAGGVAPGLAQPATGGGLQAADPGAAGGGVGGNAPRMTLEILVVEIPDPKL